MRPVSKPILYNNNFDNLNNRSSPTEDHKTVYAKQHLICSVLDPDPYWIRIQELSGSGFTHENIG